MNNMSHIPSVSAKAERITLERPPEILDPPQNSLTFYLITGSFGVFVVLSAAISIYGAVQVFWTQM